jgi:hypothetical protein
MITEFGKNLHILFIADVNEDWQAYSSWYSVYKNLPYATCSLSYFYENDDIPFQLFQWAKRMEIPVWGTKSSKDSLINLIWALVRLNHDRVLIMPAHTMALKPLNEDLLETFNKKDKRFIWDKRGAGFCSLTNRKLIENYDRYIISKEFPILEDESLSFEARETKSSNSLIDYKKGCGKWIDTKKGCPFSSVGGLISTDMTVNEQIIFELWRKTVPLYNSIK